MNYLNNSQRSRIKGATRLVWHAEHGGENVYCKNCKTISFTCIRSLRVQVRAVWIARILIRYHIANNIGGSISYKTPISLFTLAILKGQFMSAVTNNMTFQFKRINLTYDI